MIQYDIIIPNFAVGHLTQLCLKCLQTIRQYSEDYRLIFVDNASPEFDTLEDELNQHPRLLVQNSKNLGFVKAVNQGLLLSTAPYIVLLNNDTEAVDEWLPKLSSALVQNVGLSGPRTTTPGSWQGRWQGTEGTVILPRTAMLAFFCVMLRREVVHKVGLLDEQFGVGFGDDDDYCNRAQSTGYQLALVQDLVIPHHHRSTFKTLYSTDTIRLMQHNALALYHHKSGR